MAEILGKEAFLTLIKLGIGHEAPSIPESIDWKRVKALAEKQGLSAIVFDGVLWLSDRDLLTDGRQIDSKFKMLWIGSYIQLYEHKYKDYKTRIGQLAYFYNTHGFKLMALKGYGLSLNYPIPSHRPVGDIDIWAFGKYKEADAALNQELGIQIDNSHHHHTVFSFMDYPVENHYDWVNVYEHKSSAEIEKIFKQLAMDDSNFIEIDSQRVYLPSPNLHALFLLRHSLSHFASTSMTIRQLLDWAFFVEKHKDKINWAWLLKTMEQFHMTDFFMCLNHICIKRLGFSKDIFPPVVLPASSGDSLPERILNDMLMPEFSEESPRSKGVVARVLFKYRRWRANGWKHHLCYKESMFTSFFVSAWAHLMKPSSI